MNTKYMIFTGLIVLGSFTASAQKRNPPDPDAMAKRTVERMSLQLSLDKPAQDSLTIIYKDFYTQMEKSFKDGDREALKPLAEKRDERIKKILSPEQYAKYVKESEKRRTMQPERPRGPEKAGDKGEKFEEPHQ
jgi:hypothetical protein